jgi:hypothetical protein
MWKKALLGSTVVTAVGTGIGACAIYADIQRKQVYPCQPFTEALKQYISYNSWKALGRQSKVRLFHCKTKTVEM